MPFRVISAACSVKHVIRRWPGRCRFAWASPARICRVRPGGGGVGFDPSSLARSNAMIIGQTENFPVLGAVIQASQIAAGALDLIRLLVDRGQGDRGLLEVRPRGRSLTLQL